MTVETTVFAVEKKAKQTDNDSSDAETEPHQSETIFGIFHCIR
jgi:hypothetical protein